MNRVRFVCLVLALACLLGTGSSALAAEVDCDATYCFTSQDFSEAEEPLAGICITGLPENSGTVLLGNRILHSGDILTADQIALMTFSPLQTDENAEASVSYLPIYENRVEPEHTMTISIRGKSDQPPVAQDSTMETYKNIPNEGKLKVSDPEGDPLRCTLVREPKRGEVVLNEDGSFTYTPKKNKVGVDSFTYTAADPAGNVSREATVTVQILKPSEARQYSDTANRSCQFEAEWLRSTGLFAGESISGENCFQPDKAVSQGEFLAMMVKTLDIPAEEVSTADLPADTPLWLKPYLAAAIRSGLTAGLPQAQSDSLDTQAPITGAEAAVMIQNALDLSLSQQALETMAANSDMQPDWAATALTVMNDNGIMLTAEEVLTRSQAAEVLYQVSRLAITAPGTAVFRMQ